MARVTVRSLDGLKQEIAAGRHTYISDLAPSQGGCDEGAEPYQLLLAALGACIGMTLRMYADHKGWPLESVRVELEHEKIDARECPECRTTEGTVDRIRKRIYVSGDLTEQQMERLKYISTRCPVNQTLSRGIHIVDSIELESVPAPA